MNSYFIIDNNCTTINRINNLLVDFPTFKSHGHSASYDEAMNTILKKKPDIVFINVDDDVLSSPFSLVTELNTYLEVIPSFVALASTNKHAYKTIKHSFIDYLINPIPELEVRKLILKYKKKRSQTTTATLCLQSYKDFQYINTDEVLFLKADNNTTDFYMNSGKVISAYKTLKTFENTLPNNFLRIHKSYIVNKNFVSRINYGKHKCTVDKTIHKIPFTKTYIDNIDYIKESLSILSVTNQN